MLLKNKIKRLNKHTWNGVPATVRPSLLEASLYESVFSSVFWHIVGIGLIWLITFCITVFGLAPILFPKPQSKVKDIEFIIKNQTHVHYVAPKAATNQLEGAAGPKRKTSPITENKPVTPPVAQPQHNLFSHHSPAKSLKGGKISKHSKSSGISSFTMPMPNLKSMSSGLGGSYSGHARGGHSAGFDAASSGFNSVGGSGNGTAYGKGSSGRGFDKTTTRKMITSFDISPYVNELRREIRWNWKSPDSSKRVELFLRIAKDGRIVILNVKRTSEAGNVDNAALNAVRKCTPLNPLPSKYPKGYLDVVFTFGANSVGSRY